MSLHRLNIELAWPPRDLHPNARAHRMKRARVAREYKESCARRAHAACHWLARPLDRARIQITFIAPDHRGRDIDNLVAAMKAGIDGLVGIVIKDDSAACLEWDAPRLEVDPENCKVEVTIEERSEA